MTPRRFITVASALAAMLALSTFAFATPATAAAAPLAPMNVGATEISLVRVVLSFLMPGIFPPATPGPSTQSAGDPQGAGDGSSPFPFSLKAWQIPSGPGTPLPEP